MGVPPSNPSPQSSVNPAEEEAERMNESNGMQDTRRTMSSKSAGQGSYGLMGLKQQAQGRHGSAPGLCAHTTAVSLVFFMGLLSV